jgi:hypothetical protein
MNPATFIAMPVILNVHQVTLAEHVEPHRRVRVLHGRSGQRDWRHTQQQAMDYIESGLFAYFLLEDSRAVRLVVGRTAIGEKFLKAEPDGETPDRLLRLPSPDGDNPTTKHV